MQSRVFPVGWGVRPQQCIWSVVVWCGVLWRGECGVAAGAAGATPVMHGAAGAITPLCG